MDKARAYIFLIVLGIAGILFLVNSAPQKKETASAQIITAWGGRGEQSVAYNSLFPISAKENRDSDQMESVWLSFLYKIPPASGNSNDKDPRKQMIPFYPEPGKAAQSPSSSEQNEQISSQGNNSFFDNAYSFIPTGFISTSISQTPAKTRTQEEKGYFDYGNAVGLEIQTFDNSHKETTAILDAFFKDYKDPSKREAVLAIARDYERLANDLSAIENVPSGLSQIHFSLSEGYGAISNGLSRLTIAGNDQEMAGAVLAYDASAEEFIKKFVALAGFFSARGIKFSPSDPGSIFQFNN